MSESALKIGGDTILRLRGDASPAALLSPPKTPGLVARRDHCADGCCSRLPFCLRSERQAGLAGIGGRTADSRRRPTTPICRPTRSSWRRKLAVLSQRSSPATISRQSGSNYRPDRRSGFPGRVSQSKADLDKARASVDGVASALVQQQAKIEEAKADVTHATAALDFAIEEQKRYNDLLGRGAGTVQRSHQAISDFQQKQAVLDKAKASYDAALKQTDGLRSLEDAARASLQRSEINLEQAKLNLDYTTITAPIDGVVGDRALRKGNSCSPVRIS